MAKTDFKSVTEYLATLPPSTRAILQRVRSTLRKAVPKGEEVISYQIPALKLEGSAVIYFAGWKEHYSLYPATKGVVSELARELADYDLRKGTIRFPLSERVPTKLIAAIAKIRTAETVSLLAERKEKRGKVVEKKSAGSAQAKKKKAKVSAKKRTAAARKRRIKKPRGR